jgi:HSP20 family protein
MKAISDRIERRAFEVFERRGCAADHSLDDWLQAEREIVRTPDVELIEKDGKFQVRLAAPAYDLKDIRVTAMPTALIVHAESKHGRQKHEGDVYLCEFGRRDLYRRLDLPAPINVDKVSASFEDGILQLTAPKTADPANKLKALGAGRF